MKVTTHKGKPEDGMVRHQVFINDNTELVAKIFISIPEKYSDKEEKILNALQLLKHI